MASNITYDLPATVSVVTDDLPGNTGRNCQAHGGHWKRREHGALVFQVGTVCVVVPACADCLAAVSGVEVPVPAH